jgi:predicted DNA-binding transcriptional regulator AlpA
MPTKTLSRNRPQFQRETLANSLLDTPEVAALLGVSQSTVRAKRSLGRYAGMPEPLRTISGSPVWSRLEIEEWIRELEEQSA